MCGSCVGRVTKLKARKLLRFVLSSQCNHNNLLRCDPKVRLKSPLLRMLSHHQPFAIFGPLHSPFCLNREKFDKNCWWDVNVEGS